MVNDLQVRHLELIQAVITRFSTTSFIIKGWSLTVSGALYGYTVSHLTWRLALVALFPVVPFWYLDTFFLYHERLFRCLYDDVRLNNSAIEPFAMHIGAYKSFPAWRSAATSVTLSVFYGMIVAVGLTILASSLWQD
jgi:hypothetical protein